MTYLFAFIVGSVVGSFLNVCIYRMPRGESVVHPWSHCPNCNRTIPWHDNIPFISYIFLKGRCRFCKAKISFRYFLVEGVTACAFASLLWRFGFGADYIIYAAFTAALIIISFVDLEHWIIPGELSIWGVVSGLVLSGLYPGLHNVASWTAGFKDSFAGVLVGGGAIYLIRFLGTVVFKKEAMGLGDAELLAFIGAFLGWKLTLFTFFAAPILGSVVGVPLKVLRRQEAMPYGPFLSAAAFIAVFWGNKILDFIFPLY